ncbi:MAG: CmcJ/NvfI family oxidoreductase [Gammaproteobacteria bacterium]|jgi:hypothetical protein
MSVTAETTGVFNYLPPGQPGQQLTTEEGKRLASAAAVEPILKRWRHRCSEGLIDDTGKIRNVFTKASSGAEHTVSRVIRELNEIPEAVAEFGAAFEARQQLSALTQHSVEMPVRNARLLTDASLDGCGFQLERHTSKVTDWQDDRQLADIYHEEINALVKRVTGATHAFSSNHLFRQSEPEVGGNGPLAKLMAQSRGPVRTAHNDFAESYGEGIIRTIASGGVPHTQTFGMTEAVIEAGLSEAELRHSRMLVINTWRAVGPEPLRRFPLALADRRSVPRACLRANLIGKVPSGQPRGGIDVYSALHDPGHQWYFYPEMTRDEVLLWKGYDSAEVPAKPTLHSSFDDPNTPPGAPERMSVEVRVLCLLPTEAA